jgi:hypothetical protein
MKKQKKIFIPSAGRALVAEKHAESTPVLSLLGGGGRRKNSSFAILGRF